MGPADVLIYLDVVVARMGQSNAAVEDAPILVGNPLVHIGVVEHLIVILIKLLHFSQERLAGPGQVQKRSGLGRLVVGEEVHSGRWDL